MELVKFAPKEKTEEDKIWEIAVKDKSLYSFALRLLTEEYPEKFDDKLNFIPIVKGETITLTGNFDILKTEVYRRVIAYGGEKKTYTIILRKK